MTERMYPQGVPCWIDTTQPDIAAAAQFYAGLFGWTFEDAMPPGAPNRYLIAKLAGQDVAGMAGGREDVTAWSTYIAVDDVDATARRLVASGATMLSGPTDAGEGGRGAALADPEGVEFRLWQAKRRLGAQAVNQPGSWNFSDLHTNNTAASISFYTAAFGWQVDDVDFGMMVRQPGYGDHLEATTDPDIRSRQAEIAAPPGFEDAIGWVVPTSSGESPHWHVTFAVAHRDQAAAAATRLGGQVLGKRDTAWTRDALIKDPQGAVFTASQFTPPTE